MTKSGTGVIYFIISLINDVTYNNSKKNLCGNLNARISETTEIKNPRNGFLKRAAKREKAVAAKSFNL